MPASRLLVFLCLLPGSLPAAAPPRKIDRAKQADRTIREVAGSAEYLRGVPKRFGVIEAIDPARHQVTLRFDGEKQAKAWPLAEDAEVKVAGWWGRLDQLTPGERVWVWCDGVVHAFERARRAGGGAAEHDHDLTAPMPGRVRRVDVAPGQSVERGAVLVALEAMKMEHAIRAPRDGVVRRVLVREGDLVDAGAELVELEPART